MADLYIKYALIGTDKLFSYCPAHINDNGEIVQDDALYDFADTPFMVEAHQKAIPHMSKQYAASEYGEYYNDQTGLYMYIDVLVHPDNDPGIPGSPIEHKKPDQFCHLCGDRSAPGKLTPDDEHTLLCPRCVQGKAEYEAITLLRESGNYEVNAI